MSLVYNALKMSEELSTFENSDLQAIKEACNSLDVRQFKQFKICINAMIRCLDVLRICENLEVIKEDSNDGGDVTVKHLTTTEKKIFRDLLHELRIMEEALRNPDGKSKNIFVFLHNII